MSLITCNIGFPEDIQLTANDKFELDEMLRRKEGLDVEFGNTVTEITIAYYPNIQFGIMGFRLDEPSDESVGYAGGDMGVNYLCFHSSYDIKLIVNNLITRANRQKIPYGVKIIWSLKSKKAINLNGLVCESFVIGYDEQSDMGY
jgi:hypothetical protein